jgi:lysophospholipase L1-like esterase
MGKSLMNRTARVFFTLALMSSVFFHPTSVLAQESLLQDFNNDNTVSVIAFGDSLTFGLGDIYSPGQVITEINPSLSGGGYPAILSGMIGLPIANAGVPGEVFVSDGVGRLPRVLQSANADVLLFMQGTNDAVFQVNAGSFRNRLQRVINVALALGERPVLLTLPPTCCLRAGQNLFIDSYNQQIFRLQNLNQIPVADVNRAFRTTCENKRQCELLNVPEGLHPNSVGYQVIAETVAATLNGIDIFSEAGRAELAQVLGVDEILTKAGE